MSFDVRHVDVDSYVLGESRDGSPKFQRWHRLVELAASRGVRSISTLGMLAGGFANGYGTPVIWCTRADSDLVADLALIASTYGHGLVWSVPRSAIRPGLSHALGLGVVCAVTTSRPATELGVGTLRTELRETAGALSDEVGYAPFAFDPQKSDPLVRAEAERLGLRLELRPTPIPSELAPADACRWLEGDLWIRARARLASVAGAALER